MAQMMADLNNIRRDGVSDPSNNGGVVPDPRIKRKAAEHRAAALAASASVSKWHNAELFDADAIAQSLSIHSEGQGYREELQSQNPSGTQRIVGVGGGGDRSGRGNHGGSGGRGGGRGGAHGGAVARGAYSGSSRAALPAHAPPSLTGLSLPVLSTNRGRAPHLIATATSSPAQPIPIARSRAAQVQTEVPAAGSAAPIPSTPTPRIAATLAPASTARTQAAQGGHKVRGPATAPAPSPSREAARSRPPSTASGTNGLTTTDGMIMRVARTAETGSQSPQTAVAESGHTTPADHYRNIANTKMAEYYAANPGAKCDQYYSMFPDRRPYLEQALKKLAEPKQKKSEEMTIKVDDPGKVKIEQVVMEGLHNVAKVETVEKVEKEKIVKAAGKTNAAAAVKETSKDTTKQENVNPVQKTTKPAAPASASSVGSSPRSAASKVSKSTEASATTPPPPTAELPSYGKLVVTYYDADSNHLSTRNVKINAPVQANLQITSRARLYDPRALDATVQTLSKMLRLHNTQIRLERGDDGLWQEIDEQDDQDDE